MNSNLAFLPYSKPLIVLAALLILGGCASGGDPRDPLEPMNRGIYKFNDAADKAVLKPVAQGYKAVLPEPVRKGVTNFFSNIDDVLVAVNNVLQFKLNDAVSDLGRVVTNTTVGVAGVFDVASGWGMPKHNEDFGQTLGYWGIGDGPFLMLPLLGPSNVRDSVGLLIYYRLDPVVHLHDVPLRNSLTALRFVDKRARLLDAEKVLDEAALDPYTFLRDAYIQQRRNLVHDGNAPPEKYDEEKDSPPPASPKPASKPQSSTDNLTPLSSKLSAETTDGNASLVSVAPTAATAAVNEAGPGAIPGTNPVTNAAAIPANSAASNNDKTEEGSSFSGLLANLFRSGNAGSRTQ